MKSLSDETRLRTLSLLLERECCVCEVMRALDISQSKASRSLSALYDAGFLRLRRDGTWVFYSIDRDGMQEYYSELVDALQKALEGNKVLKVDRERLRQIQPVISRRTANAH
jgi:ArsR family transcriptional regulator